MIALANDSATEKLRVWYVEAVDNESKIESALSLIKEISVDHPIVLAYQGAFEALKAKHVWSPYTKLECLNQGQNILRKAIQKDPDNVEIRFLRFSINHYLPDFLRDSSELILDKKTIYQNIETSIKNGLTSKVVHTIAQFMIDSKRCTFKEKQLFTKLVK